MLTFRPASHLLLATFSALALLTLPAQGQTPPAAQAPVSVMILGGFHMSNPGQDLHNVSVDDVLQPEPQAQIAKVNAALATFHPNEVMAEWPAQLASDRYAQYLAGTLPPSHNEVVQLGFRLAKTAGLAHFYGIDVDGEFPYQPVLDYAKAHGEMPLLDHENEVIEQSVKTIGSTLHDQGIAATLRYLNDPVRLRQDNSFYRQTLRIGGGSNQPGADLLTAWYRRNFLICANIVQNSHPGDRIVVFYGSGHAFLLRQCVAETPGFVLVEPNSYLPGNR